jgi:hypothetical protein
MAQNKADQEKTDPHFKAVPLMQAGKDYWVWSLEKGRVLEWGHRFDEGIGYRVFLKYVDSFATCAFYTSQVRKLAHQIEKNEVTPQILQLAPILRQLANDVEKLNKLWAKKGCPDLRIDQLAEKTGEIGHA